MKRMIRSRWLLAGAVAQALVAMAALPAAGQVAVQQDGHALDANNRVGSAGLNFPASGRGAAGPNQIIYGNVTGGKEFRGPIAAPDPGAFFGPVPGGMMDRFIAGSSAAPQPYQPSFSLSTPQPFYGQSRGAPPPVGTVREGYTGSYLGTNTLPRNSMGMTEFNSALDYRTQRLGESSVLGAGSTLAGTEPGDLLLQGPLEADNQATLFTGSPLYGVRLFRAGETSPGGADALGLLGPSSLYPNRADRFRYDAAEVRRLRAQLQPDLQNSHSGKAGPQALSGAESNNPQPGGQGPGSAAGQQSLQQRESSLNARSQAQGGTINNSAVGSSGVNTGQGTVNRSTLITPGQQSPQYNEMQRRLRQYENPLMAAIETEHQAKLERQAQARQANAAPPPPANSSNPQKTRSPAMLRQPGRSKLNLPPMRVESMATGMRGSGVRDLLKSAEGLMRQGKFQSAIDKYNLAQQAVPNNPLIPLGRANAELGAGFYRQASDDLHRVFLSDRATLMAQYDLSAWLSPERLTFVTRELQSLASHNPHDEMPAFLLAYISYNTGHDADAAKYLKQAQDRADHADPLLNILQTHWKLPDLNAAPEPQSDLNK